jgi:4'-phosphopantetheinyl transferase
MKESVVKADGRGLSLPLTSIEAVDGFAVADNRRWSVRRLEMAAGYSCHLASDHAGSLPALARIEL